MLLILYSLFLSPPPHPLKISFSTTCEVVRISIAEPHHFYAVLVPGKKFEAVLVSVAPVPVPAMVSTILYSKTKIFKNEIKFK
jgi:hypothetical protein